MTAPDPIVTPTTRTDAVLRIVEDVLVVGGTAVGTYLSTHSAADVAAAVTAAPIVRSGIAQALTNRRVSGLVAALKLVYGSIQEMNAARPAPAHAASAPVRASTAAVAISPSQTSQSVVTAASSDAADVLAQADAIHPMPTTASTGA
jgi:hypothetical protein